MGARVQQQLWGLQEWNEDLEGPGDQEDLEEYLEEDLEGQARLGHLEDPEDQEDLEGQARP